MGRLKTENFEELKGKKTTVFVKKGEEIVWNNNYNEADYKNSPEEINKLRQNLADGWLLSLKTNLDNYVNNQSRHIDSDRKKFAEDLLKSIKEGKSPKEVHSKFNDQHFSASGTFGAKSFLVALIDKARKEYDLQSEILDTVKTTYMNNYIDPTQQKIKAQEAQIKVQEETIKFKDEKIKDLEIKVKLKEDLLEAKTKAIETLEDERDMLDLTLQQRAQQEFKKDHSTPTNTASSVSMDKPLPELEHHREIVAAAKQHGEQLQALVNENNQLASKLNVATTKIGKLQDEVAKKTDENMFLRKVIKTFTAWINKVTKFSLTADDMYKQLKTQGSDLNKIQDVSQLTKKAEKSFLPNIFNKKPS